MTDDLRERIARALWESRRSRLAGTDMHAARADADEILAVVRPVIEQAERERDPARLLRRRVVWTATGDKCHIVLDDGPTKCGRPWIGEATRSEAACAGICRRCER